ncbi:MAG: NADH-quinone oxidoreductase subunit M, partial [Anaerolinea sp.]|nr:NADH-quinone oxidoreductase subunit M [Anaerolinea sp.]
MQLPVLSIIIFSPIIAGLIIFLLPKERVKEIKALALASTGISLLLSLVVYFAYDIQTAGYQLVERIPWAPALGISYLVGVDGISAPMILLTGLVACTGVMISWGVAERPREFFGFLLILAGSVFGVFASMDLFMLFFFFEIAVFPKFLMITVWGWPKTRVYGAMKLTLYLFIGSVIALVGALAIYTQSGLNTFDL